MDLTEANAKIFATYPRDGVSIGQALGTSIIGTCLMVHSIYGVNDAKNSSKPTSNLGKFERLKCFSEAEIPGTTSNRSLSGFPGRFVIEPRQIDLPVHLTPLNSSTKTVLAKT